MRSANLSRRVLLTGAGALALSVAITSFATFGIAQDKSGPAEIPVDDLMKPGELPELSLGPADAKVTIVEYASMTCGACANFHNKVFPKLKEKYVDSGKVRFILREFPIDPVAAAASMLARCAGEGKTYPLVETLFATQENWAFEKDQTVPKLLEIAKQAGFTEERFYACLKDEKLLNQVNAVRSRGADVFGVNATPTFFINGKKLAGAPTIEAFDKAIEPLLAKS